VVSAVGEKARPTPGSRDSELIRAVRSVARVQRRARSRLARPLLGSVTGVHTTERVAALTFDDGPDPDSTPCILDILDRHGARATFFMVGESARRHRAIVERAAASGHAIGNHTWDHPAFPLIGRRERFRQILACEQALAPYGARLFRPPYGFQSQASYLDARVLGYRVVGWSGATQDWLDHPAGPLSDRITQALHPGSILLLHDVLHHTIADSFADRSPLLEALDRVLTSLSGEYRFVTVPELLRHGKPRKTTWFKPANKEWLNGLSNGAARQY
jgi:peptidoglycan-N-acetylglucosamine deacetylase